MLAIRRKMSGVEATIALLAALAIGGSGTALGLAAASLAGDAREEHGIQLVRPLHVSPEVDRANHDQANH
jgi:hypothetical protein